MPITIEERYFKYITAAVVLVSCMICFSILKERYSEREARFQQLDSQSLDSKITQVKKKTKELRKAAQLNPVWENWRIAKDIASSAGLTLTTSKDSQKSRQIWVGTLSGGPILVLAVAQRIQQKIAAQMIKMDYMSSSARLEIAILGTDSTQH